MARIAVVEDDPGTRMLIELKLRGAGHEVTGEADGESGLAMLRRTVPDLVLLDWMLPRLTGLEVCLAARADATLASVPIVLLTSKGQEADVVRGLRAGANDYVSKPFSPLELMERIDRLLRTSTA